MPVAVGRALYGPVLSLVGRCAQGVDEEVDGVVDRWDADLEGVAE